MTITLKSVKILWSSAAGICSFPKCGQRLTFPEAEGFAPYTLGEMAHICGDKPGSNRHDPEQSAQERDDYQNLILLCPTHHGLIDRPENEARFPVVWLHQIKAEHETSVQDRLGPAPADRIQAATEIIPLLGENHLAWSNYGPGSKIARENPHSDSAYATWTSERLTTIVPNNRRISAILQVNAAAFTPEEQHTIAKFQLHVRTYERWVEDEISYEGVTRFPIEFGDLIRGIADGGA